MTEDLKISALFGMEESWKTLHISPIMIVVWSISCIMTAYYEGVKEDMQKDAAQMAKQCTARRKQQQNHSIFSTMAICKMKSLQQCLYTRHISKQPCR